MSYISREAAIEAVKESHDCGEWLQETLARIYEIPAADVVEVIRCKDCKYWLPHRQFGWDDEFDEYNDYCSLLVPDDDYYAVMRSAENFCSYAERRET